MTPSPQSLGEALPDACARVRDLMGQYKEVQALCQSANCKPAIHMMGAALRQADEAMISGNVIHMLRAFNTLKGFEE